MKKLLTIAVLFFATSAFAAAHIFVKLGDLKGDSTDPSHPGWFTASSFSWGASHTYSPTGDGHTATTNPHDVVVTLQNGAAATASLTQLKSMMMTGKSLTAIVDFGLVRYTLEQTLVSGLSYSGAAGSQNGLNTVTLKLNFRKFTMETNNNPRTSSPEPEMVSRTTVNSRALTFPGDAQLFVNDAPGERVDLLGLRFTGEHSAVLTLREVGGGSFQRTFASKKKLIVQKDYIKYTLTDCVISSYSKAGDGTITAGLTFGQYYGPVGGFHP